MTHIINNIELLRDKLNQMIISKNNNVEVYAISTELDTWIARYYKHK